MRKRIMAISAAFLILWAMFGFVRPAKATDWSWFKYQGDYVDYGLAPLNLSTTTVATGANGHVKIQVELVTTIYQYDYDRKYPDEEYVYFKVVAYIKAFADPGYDAQYAEYVWFDLDKIDSNQTHTWTRMDVDPNSRGVSQGYCLSQTTTLSSTSSERWDLIRVPLEYAVSLMCEPVGFALFLVDWAQAFQATPEVDYADANRNDGEAWSSWGNGCPDGDNPPYRQYAFNVFYWRMDGDVAPSVDYGLRIRAWVSPRNPAVIPTFITAPIYLYIYPNTGGSCPYLSIWNGTRYVLDNAILPGAETSNGADVEDYYTVQQRITPIYKNKVFSLYSLQIREFEREHDFIDQVKLLAVEHPPDVNVGVSPYGEILTYANPVPPASATDNNGASLVSLLSSINGYYYQSCNGSYVIITFDPTDISNGAKLVIREDGPIGPPQLKCPVYVEVLNATGDWSVVATFYTRKYWTTDIINMTDYLPDRDGNLKIRLRFISNDKIDFAGLDTTPQASIETYEANLITALHSTQGEVKTLLANNDEVYAELVLGQRIYFVFLLVNNQSQSRTFILYAEGHYIVT